MENDRRKYLRFNVSLPLKIENEVSNEIVEGLTRNFSREGFSFKTDREDYLNQRSLSFQIQLPQSNKSVRAKADLIWKEKKEDNYWVGVKLQEIDKGDKIDILDYAYTQWLERVKRVSVGEEA